MTEKKPSRRAVALLVAGGLLFGAIVAEAGVRLAGYRPALIEPDMFVALDDDLCPFGLKPGWDGYYCGKRVTVDERGYRTVRSDVPNPARAAEANPKTVLLLGDSVVFGQGLEDHETFASRLQLFYDREGAAVRVENIGVPAYSTLNEVGALRRYFAQGGKADVVLVIWVSNDPTDDPDPLGIRSGKFRQLSDSATHRILGWTYRRWFSSYLVSSGLKRLRAEAGAPPAERVEEVEAVRRSVERLGDMRRLALENGAGLSLAVYFDPPMVDELAVPSSWTNALLALMGESGFAPARLISHVKALRGSDRHVAYNDPHPSARAVGNLVDDISRQLADGAGL